MCRRPDKLRAGLLGTAFLLLSLFVPAGQATIPEENSIIFSHIAAAGGVPLNAVRKIFQDPTTDKVRLMTSVCPRPLCLTD